MSNMQGRLWGAFASVGLADDRCKPQNECGAAERGCGWGRDDGRRLVGNKTVRQELSVACGVWRCDGWEVGRSKEGMG